MANRNRLIQFALFILTLISSTTIFADVKIKTRTTANGGTANEQIMYIKGKRQRSEDGGGGSISIMQCDLRRMVRLAPAAKTYESTSFDELFGTPIALTSTTKTEAQTQKTVMRGGTVTTTVTTKDTGERKQMFGYTARRLVITHETKSSPDACSKGDSKVEIETWVIDAEFALVCDRGNENGYVGRPVDGCQDKHVIKTVDTAKQGYPLFTKMMMFDDGGKPTFSSVTEVIELSKSNLDQALFDVPSDYREAKNSSELYAATSKNSTSATKMPQMPGESNLLSDNSEASIKNMSNNSGNISTSVGTKKTGVIRLGLAGVKTSAAGEGVNPSELSAAVQNTLAEYLKMPNVELIALDAKLPSAIDAEAKEKQCDFVIYAQVSHKKGGGGMFGKALGKLSETVARQAYGSSDTFGKATQVTIMSAAAATGNVKAKDQITLEIKLITPGNASAVAAKQFQGKAKSDGEDILTPLIEQAAQMIVDASAKK